jgi:hypothetical protein
MFMDVVKPQENQLAIYSDFLRHFLQSLESKYSDWGPPGPHANSQGLGNVSYKIDCAFRILLLSCATQGLEVHVSGGS